MSAFTLTPDNVNRLSVALRTLTRMTRDTSVNVCAYGQIDIQVADGNFVSLAWDSDSREYIIKASE